MTLPATQKTATSNGIGDLRATTRHRLHQAAVGIRTARHRQGRSTNAAPGLRRLVKADTISTRSATTPSSEGVDLYGLLHAGIGAANGSRGRNPQIHSTIVATTAASHPTGPGSTTISEKSIGDSGDDRALGAVRIRGAGRGRAAPMAVLAACRPPPRQMIVAGATRRLRRWIMNFWACRVRSRRRRMLRRARGWSRDQSRSRPLMGMYTHVHQVASGHR